MTPFYTDDWLTLYGGDCREVLRSLPADSVDCVVTSPPYWGLRDYGTATWTGGEEGHEHIGSQTRSGPPGSAKQASKRGSTDVYSGDCSCGAQRVDSQLGLERTPEEYVANMVAVFAEVRRVLKPSGTCWLNLGDSYANSPASGGTQSPLMTGGEHKRTPTAPYRRPDGLKPKDLVGIPWRVAFALQADGWYLRSDIIWSKPNPMPESVTDRPTKSHEYLFLLTKSARYYFDADAVREPHVGPLHNPGNKTDNGRLTASMGHLEEPDRVWGNAGGRNVRSVWTIATRPYPGAHFAVFPPELPERCIKAGSSERGVCPECGAPWERVVERTPLRRDHGLASERNPGGMKARDPRGNGASDSSTLSNVASHAVKTTDWKPTCICDGADWTPQSAVVLDPFAGSGTVGMVANRLSRRAILIDLNPEYLVQQMKRNAQTPLGLGA